MWITFASLNPGFFEVRLSVSQSALFFSPVFAQPARPDNPRHSVQLRTRAQSSGRDPPGDETTTPQLSDPDSQFAPGKQPSACLHSTGPAGASGASVGSVCCRGAATPLISAA